MAGSLFCRQPRWVTAGILFIIAYLHLKGSDPWHQKGPTEGERIEDGNLQNVFNATLGAVTYKTYY